MAQNLNPNALQRGCMTSYADAYTRERRIEDEMLQGVMMDDDQSGRTQKYAYLLPAAPMEYRPYGEPANQTDLDSRGFDITLFQYSQGVRWLAVDRRHQVAGDPAEQAGQIGLDAGNMRFRAFVDLCKDTETFLAETPQAADGLPAYSTNTRFETAGGNVVGGQTMTTQAGIRQLVAALDDRYRQFKNSWGEPLLKESTLRTTMKLFFGSDPAQNLAIAEAFGLQIVEGTTKAAGTSNILRTNYGGRAYEIIITSRFSAGECYAFLTGAKEPFINTTTGPIQPYYGNGSNSDDTRINGYEYVQFEKEDGYGIGEVFATVKATT